MPKLTAALLMLMVMICCARAQPARYEVRGTLKDSADRFPVKAVVELKDDQAGTLTKVVMSDEHGVFVIPCANIPTGSYTLTVKAGGYSITTLKVHLSSTGNNIVLPVTFLVRPYQQLKDIVVKSSPPVEMKKDTVSFDLPAYHAAPNAGLGESLNRLPGLEVSGGQVTAMGQKVTRVLLNGNQVFDDPLQTLRVIPRDMVKKVKVFDARTDESRVMGMDDGQRIRTINIVTKPGVTARVSGRISTASGTSGVYDNALALSRLAGDQVMAAAANLNNTGGEAQPGGQAAGGINRLASAGLNYTKKIGRRTRLTGSYTGMNSRLSQLTQNRQENFVPGDSSFYARREQSAQNNQAGHLLNIRIDPDGVLENTFSLNAVLEVKNFDNNTLTNSLTTKGISTPVNSSAAVTGDKGQKLKAHIEGLYAIKLKKPGRTTGMRFNYAAGKERGDGNNRYANTLSADSVVSADQRSISSTRTNNAGIGLFYAEPLTKISKLIIRGDFAAEHFSSDKNVQDFDGQKYRPDSLLSNLFRSTYTTSQLGAAYEVAAMRFNLAIGITAQQALLSFNTGSFYNRQNRKYRNLLPRLRLRFPQASGSLEVLYQGNAVAPDGHNLDPVIINTDPLHIKQGNPGLKQPYTHTASVNFQKVNSRRELLSFMVKATLFENSITNYTTTSLLTGVDSSRPVNVNGNYDVSAQADYSISLFKGLKMTAGATGQFNRSIGFVNGVSSRLHSWWVTESIRLVSNFQRNIDFIAGYSPSQYFTSSPGQPQFTTHYQLHTVNAEVNYYTKGGLLIGSALNYHAYTGRAKGFNTTVAVCNASIGHILFRDAEIKLAVNDLFNMNKSITRTVTPTGITDTNSRVLGRYFFVKLTYNLKNVKRH